MDVLMKKHKSEKRDLQNRIQLIKHGVPKGDKKKKKEATAEVALLEAELSARHEEEIEMLQNKIAENQETSKDCPISDTNQITSENMEPKRVSKAQKRRNKKAEHVKDRSQDIAEQEIMNLTGTRNVESEALSKILSEKGLRIYEIPSDGDCLYKAVEHQLSVLDLEKIPVSELRLKTSQYMLSHCDDFWPFLTNPETGDLFSDEQYTSYCVDIATKPVWGGQVEIQALSEVCGHPIEVIQSQGPNVTTRENSNSKKLVLSYHRHMYGLGEHYNSVIKKTAEDDNDESF